jgi:hypothetical protein
MPKGPQGQKRPAGMNGTAVTAADAAKRIAERSGLLVLRYGSASRISLIEGDGGRFALAVDPPRHLGRGSIYLRRLDGLPFEPGHVLAPQEAERAARTLLGIDKRESTPITNKRLSASAPRPCDRQISTLAVVGVGVKLRHAGAGLVPDGQLGVGTTAKNHQYEDHQDNVVAASGDHCADGFMRVDTAAYTDPLQALKPLATLLAKREITAPEFDAAVAYLGTNDGRRTAIEATMPRVEGKIVRNLRMLHPTDAVIRAVPCSPADVVHRLRKALDQLGQARTASDAPPLTESRRRGRADETPAPIRSDARQFRTGPYHTRWSAKNRLKNLYLSAASKIGEPAVAAVFVGIASATIGALMQSMLAGASPHSSTRLKNAPVPVQESNFVGRTPAFRPTVPNKPEKIVKAAPVLRRAEDLTVAEKETAAGTGAPR